MSWMDKMNDAISYIEEHLDEENNIEKISQIAGCSSYHFQRMFSFITEVSLSEYIRRRRMTLAACELLTSDIKIIGLGNDYIEEKPIWSPVGMPMMEIELLKLAGLNMKQIIEAATMGGARIIGKEQYGKIEENCIADLIAVKGDPYKLSYLLSNVQFVMKDGVIVKNN